MHTYTHTHTQDDSSSHKLTKMLVESCEYGQDLALCLMPYAHVCILFHVLGHSSAYRISLARTLVMHANYDNLLYYYYDLMVAGIFDYL